MAEGPVTHRAQDNRARERENRREALEHVFVLEKVDRKGPGQDLFLTFSSSCLWYRGGVVLLCFNAHTRSKPEQVRTFNHFGDPNCCSMRAHFACST